MAGTTQEPTMNSEQKAKITLYWLEKSRSQRVLWLLEELKVDYEIKTYKRKDMLAPAEFREVHPLGKAPIVTVALEANLKPMVLAESGFIFEYLIDHFGTWLAPKRYRDSKEGEVGGETEAWMRYKYYMHYAEGSLMPVLVMFLVFNVMKSKSPFFVKPIVSMLTGAVESNFLLPTLKLHLDFVEGQLATSPDNGEYLCGADITGVDIMMSLPLGAIRGKHGFTKEKYPKLWAYVDKLQAMDGYKRAVQKIIDVDGKYDPDL